MLIKEFNETVNLLTEKLRDLSDEKIDSLKQTVKMNLSDLALIMQKNSILTLKDNDLEYHQILYQKFKNWDNLMLSEKLLLMPVIVRILKEKI